MNKKIIAGAVLAIASGAAFAQSSVTIYGVVDAGLTASRGVAVKDTNGNVIGKKSRVGLDSGLIAGSRVGFKGTEDLGNGTAAIFNVEAGFNTDDGSNAQGSGSLFGRRAIVGLTNTTLGTVELGRQDSILDDVVAGYDSFGGAAAASAGNIIKYDDRINNSITYTTADFSGFTAKANYGFGENTSVAQGAKNSSDGRFYGLSLNYANGPFAASLAGAHSDYNGANQSVSDVKDFLASASKRDQYVLGASYDFDVVKPYALLSYGKTAQSNSTAKIKDKSAVIGVSAPFGASTVLASVGYVTVKPATADNKSGNAKQFALGYTYSLSKRTTLYAAYDYIKNSSELKNAGYEYTTATGGSQVLGLGVNHKF